MSAQPSEATPSHSTLDAWLKAMGLKHDERLRCYRNPFDFLSAENDPALAECYVPLLDESRFSRLEHLVVLGPSGSGKTALRLRCQQELRAIVQFDASERQDVNSEEKGQAKIDLRAWLATHFDADELNLLRSDLLGSEGIYPSGKPREIQAHYLIQDCERRGKLLELLARCRERRPAYGGFLGQIKRHLSPPPTSPGPLVFTAFHQARAALPPRRPQQPLAARSPENRFIYVDIADDDRAIFDEVDAEHAKRVLEPDNLGWLAANGLYLRAFLPLWLEDLTDHVKNRVKIEWDVPSLQELIRNRLQWARSTTPRQISEFSSFDLANLCDPRMQFGETLEETLARVGHTPRGVLAIGQIVLLCHVSRSTNEEPGALSIRDKIAAFRALGIELTPRGENP